MAKKKRKQFFHLRYPRPLDRPIFWDELGVQIKINGVILSGRDHDIAIWLPWQKPAGELHSIEATVEDWQAILQATDSPEVFEVDASGAIKAIHRKSMRAIGGALQWKIWRRDGFRCLYCGVEGNEKHPLTVDHFVPIELGGQDTEDNLISCCRLDNKKKGSLPPEQFCELEGLDYFGLNEYIHGRASAIFISHLNN